MEWGALAVGLAICQNLTLRLLSFGVVPPGVVVGGDLLAGDHLLGVEVLTVDASADLVVDRGLQVNVNNPGDVLASSSLGAESGEAAVSDGLVAVQLAVVLEAML